MSLNTISGHYRTMLLGLSEKAAGKGKRSCNGYKDYWKDYLPNNNAQERAISNIKVKQKICEHFKTEKTVKNFAKIRSIIDTTIKNRMNALEALALIAKLQPQTSN